MSDETFDSTVDGEFGSELGGTGATGPDPIQTEVDQRITEDVADFNGGSVAVLDYRNYGNNNIYEFAFDSNTPTKTASLNNTTFISNTSLPTSSTNVSISSRRMADIGAFASAYSPTTTINAKIVASITGVNSIFGNGPARYQTSLDQTTSTTAYGSLTKTLTHELTTSGRMFLGVSNPYVPFSPQFTFYDFANTTRRTYNVIDRYQHVTSVSANVKFTATDANITTVSFASAFVGASYDAKYAYGNIQNTIYSG